MMVVAPLVMRAAPARATTPPPLLPPKAWVVVDADTGNVIDAGNDHTPLPPASLTKVITALAAGNLPPDSPVPVSDQAAAVPADKLFMKAGEVWTFDQMLHSLLISSANDAAVALAEKAGGSLTGFQSVFARTALDLRMADHPVLMDPAGLDGSDGVSGGNLVSARDLAIAGRALLADPSLAPIVATPLYYFYGPDGVHHRLTNHNKLFLTTYAGAVGMKTGYTKRAGNCLMAAASRDGRTMLAVVLSSGNPTQAAKQLLDQGFATPVAAETAADQLPPVSQGVIAPALPDGPVTTTPLTQPVAVPPTLTAVHRQGLSQPALVLAVLTTLIGLIAVPWRRRRRRRPIFAHASYRASDRDRRAA